MIKTIKLPPGVQLDDPRLKTGEVVDEEIYLEDAPVGHKWPEDAPFEADVAGNLVPPCWGRKHVPAHYAVYPDDRFKGVRCGLCELRDRQQETSPEQ